MDTNISPQEMCRMITANIVYMSHVIGQRIKEVSPSANTGDLLRTGWMFESDTAMESFLRVLETTQAGKDFLTAFTELKLLSDFHVEGRSYALQVAFLDKAEQKQVAIHPLTFVQAALSLFSFSDKIAQQLVIAKAHLEDHAKEAFTAFHKFKKVAEKLPAALAALNTDHTTSFTLSPETRAALDQGLDDLVKRMQPKKGPRGG